MLARAGAELPPTRAVRREFTRRAIALDSIIDLAIGESSQLRYHSPTLQTAQHGLFAALDSWRCVATRLEQMPLDAARHEAETIRQGLPLQLRSPLEVAIPAAWTDDPVGLQRGYEDAARAMLALPATTHRCVCSPIRRPSCWQVLQMFTGLALLVDAPDGLSSAAEASGRACPISCPRKLARYEHSSPSERLSFCGS
jgi:hypothetical protein